MNELQELRESTEKEKAETTLQLEQMQEEIETLKHAQDALASFQDEKHQAEKVEAARNIEEL